MVCRVPIGKYHFSLIDDEDFALVSRYRWYAKIVHTGAVYAQTRFTKVIDGEPRRSTIQMQRLILDPEGTAPRSLKADHINRDTLDNRRTNLRLVDNYTSNRNRGLFKNNSTGYRGVTRVFGTQKYRAQVYAHGKRYSSPCFASPDEAAIAYNDLAIRLHGTDAILNNVPLAGLQSPLVATSI